MGLLQRAVAWVDNNVVKPVLGSVANVAVAVERALDVNATTLPAALSQAYLHTGYTGEWTVNTSPTRFIFTALSTIFVDALQIGVQLFGTEPSATIWIQFFDASGQPIGKQVTTTITSTTPLAISLAGFGVHLERGVEYCLSIDQILPDPNSFPHVTPVSYTAAEQGKVSVFNAIVRLYGLPSTGRPPHWLIPFAGSGYFHMAGVEGYVAAGTFSRTFDMGVIPSQNGVLTYSDLVPAGTSLTIAAYYTNDTARAASAGITGWTDYNAEMALQAASGVMATIPSGFYLTPARFWRFVITLHANAAHDITPKLGNMTVSYGGKPLVFSTHSQSIAVSNTGGSVPQAVKCINTISSATAALDMRLKNNMTGRIDIQLAPEPEVGFLSAYNLRGRRVHVRVGYNGLTETMPYYDGVVRDLSFTSNAYTLSVLDVLDVGEVKVPTEKYPAWLNGVNYTVGSVVTLADKSYVATQANSAAQPDISPASWNLNGGVWKVMSYIPSASADGLAWHLADVAKDVLTNHLNISGQYLNLNSLDIVKALHPAMTTSGRTIYNPVSAGQILEEIAFLLQSHWIVKDGFIHLIADKTAADVVDTISADDIGEGLQWRRGLADINNTCIIKTTYIPPSSSNSSEQFTGAIIEADALSVLLLKKAYKQTFLDKWNAPEAELKRVAADYVMLWKDGRKLLRIDVSLRKINIEAGDVIRVKSRQLPKHDTQEFVGIVSRRNMNWLKQSISLDVLEVK